MSNEEKKGKLSEDDVGTSEETTNFEDKINATLDKILEDDEDELDDIIVDYEDPEESDTDSEEAVELEDERDLTNIINFSFYYFKFLFITFFYRFTNFIYSITNFISFIFNNFIICI